MTQHHFTMYTIDKNRGDTVRVYAGKPGEHDDVAIGPQTGRPMLQAAMWLYEIELDDVSGDEIVLWRGEHPALSNTVGNVLKRRKGS